ncbi:MAG: DUF2244 domain-containing protein [Rhodobacteraceae bacterium]|nr:DUF2244 domain-containing protein [Paracoccaceae bacterium]
MAHRAEGSGYSCTSVPLSANGGDGACSGSPLYELTLRPNRSLTRKGHAVLILATFLAFAVMLSPFLGTAIWPVMLPFPLFVLWLMFTLIERNYLDGRLTEELRIWPDLITVDRIDPRRPNGQHWSAKPYWTTVHLYPNGPVENYLTLRGNSREIELGAFLSPQERSHLFEKLQRILSRSTANPHLSPCPA